MFLTPSDIPYFGSKTFENTPPDTLFLISSNINYSIDITIIETSIWIVLAVIKTNEW